MRRARAREESVKRISEHLAKKSVLWTTHGRIGGERGFQKVTSSVQRQAGEAEQIWGAAERPS